jgi:hypothetical protein
MTSHLQPSNPQTFNPAKVAYYEKAGWEAYYAREWFLAFQLMVQLNREQFRMPLWTAILASVDVVRASIAFAPLQKNNVPAAAEHIRGYYEKARQSVDIQADAQTLADLEMDYWVVHRQLARERKQAVEDGKGAIDNSAPMVESLVRLHTALFQAPSASIRRSAELRAQAAVAVDRITGGYTSDEVADWHEVEQKLVEAYTALK